MTEEELMELVGRLYVGTVARDRELNRLRAVVAEHDRLAYDRPDVQEEDPSGQEG